MTMFMAEDEPERRNDGLLHLYLSPAEKAVVYELLADGASNTEIAERLGLQMDTVKTHLRKIFERLEGIYPPCDPLNRTRFVVLILRGRVKFLNTPDRRRRGRLIGQP